jgi:hypothetical protein
LKARHVKLTPRPSRVVAPNGGPLSAQSNFERIASVGALDHWQSLAAGLAAIVATLVAVFATEGAARDQRTRRVAGS